MIIQLMLAVSLSQPDPAPAAPVELAHDVHLIRGAEPPDRGPDGNTIVIAAPDGLIVVDTGRHTFHSDSILEFARNQRRPIAAIVNTHWHLDHSSGNARLKTAFPKARVYTTRAIDRALADGGFLVRNLARTRATLNKPETPEIEKDEIRIFLATMDEREALRPDVAIERSRNMRIAGRPLDVRVTDGAVSDADVWLYDPRTRIAVIGDLVTVPVPYFETACPDRWRAAMDQVWATPFETAIPGHGRPMTREQFNMYRNALGAFIVCARSDAPAARCGTDWVDAVAPLIGNDPEQRKAASADIEYYVGYLRDNGGKSPDCLAR